MWSAICFNLDQSKISLPGNGFYDKKIDEKNNRWKFSFFPYVILLNYVNCVAYSTSNYLFKLIIKSAPLTFHSQ